MCPEGNSTTEPYICGHNALNAHAAAVDLFRTKFQNNPSTRNGAKIGIIVDGTTSFPLDENSEEDKAAAIRSMDFFFGWMAGPIWNGAVFDSVWCPCGCLIIRVSRAVFIRLIDLFVHRRLPEGDEVDYG